MTSTHLRRRDIHEQHQEQRRPELPRHAQARRCVGSESGASHAGYRIAGEDVRHNREGIEPAQHLPEYADRLLSICSVDSSCGRACGRVVELRHVFYTLNLLGGVYS